MDFYVKSKFGKTKNINYKDDARRQIKSINIQT